jgi:two-component system CheB/CheR fusion protein
MNLEDFLQITQSLPEPMFLVSGDGIILIANPAATDLLKLSDQDLCGVRLDHLVSDPADNVAHYLKVCSRSRELMPGLLVWRTRDGRIIPCRCEGAALQPRSGDLAANILLRCRLQEEAVPQFTLLDQKIADLTKEITERKRIEAMLYEQRESLRVTLASIGDAVISTDRDGQVTFMNPVAEELTGWRQEEALRRPLTDIFKILNEETRKPVENPVAKVLQQGVIIGLANHTLLIARDGTERPIDDSAAPIRDSQGNILGVILIFRDVTERRRAEEANLRLAAIVESSDDAIIGKTLDGIIMSWNAGAERIFGYSAEEVLGRHISILAPPERSDEIPKILERIRSGERIDHYETIRRRKDGQRIRISLTVSPIRDASGKIIGISKIARDITERKRAEEELRKSEEQLRAIFNQTTVGIAQTDLTGRFLFVNQRYCEIVGRPMEEVLRLRMQDLTHPEDLPHNLALFERMIAGGPAFVLEKRYIRPDGSYVWVSSSVSVVKDPQGHPQYTIVVVQDITDRKKAEEAIKEANSRKDEFLAMLVHELRNPLAPISNTLKLMQLRGIQDPVLKRSLDIMDRQVQHLTRLVDDLLDISRITQGKITLRKEPVELRILLTHAVETSRSLIETHQHELSVSLPERPIYVEVDPIRLEQVVVNLLTNAAKYTDPGGRIGLICESEEDQVVIRVWDTGIGIPSEMLDQIFDLFTQIDQSLARSRGGLGIGLTLVRSLVEMHGGSVSAYSAGLNQGSEFVVRLPISPKTPLEQPHVISETTKRDQQRLRILVVDDNIDAAVTLGEMLELWGHEVRVVYDGLSAIETASSYQPDIIILDIGLPRMNGYEVARKLRQEANLSQITLVALTGYGQGEDQDPFREAKFDYHFTKPIDLAALRRILEIKSQQRESGS